MRLQDYPSISQIASKVSDNNVNVIFAVKEDQVDLYSRLSKFIAGSTVGELANDSSNIVELVKRNYEVINQRLAQHRRARFVNASCSIFYE